MDKLYIGRFYFEGLFHNRQSTKFNSLAIRYVLTLKNWDRTGNLWSVINRFPAVQYGSKAILETVTECVVSSQHQVCTEGGSNQPTFHPRQLRSLAFIVLAWLGSFVTRSTPLLVDLAFELRESKLTIDH